MSLCRALDTTPDYLLTGTDRPRQTPEDISEKIKKLSDSNRQLLGGIINLMLEQQ